VRTNNLLTACVVTVMTLGPQAYAETVIPMQGQSPQQIQQDTAACQAQAETAYDQALASATQAAAPAPGSGPRGRQSVNARVESAA
jgi:hypothetical protein